jgi:hypothetical protein
MIAHIDKIKADLPGAVIVMTEFQSMPANSGYPAYNILIKEIAASEANVYSVDSTGAGTDGANHWTYAGLKTVGSLMVTVTKNALGLNFPGKPTSLVVTPSSITSALSWTAPVSNGGASISDYLVEYKTSAGSTWSTFSDGVGTTASATVTGLSDGVAYDFRVSAVNSSGAGNPVSGSGTTTDITAPTISSTLSTPSSTSTSISWTTDELSSSIVAYGLTTTYSASTTISDTSPRVTSHSVPLSGLVACSTYHYRVTSTDSSSNTRVGTDNTFTTSGCTGSASVSAETASNIVTASGGTSTLASGATGIVLTIPVGATGADATYQIKSLDQTAVLLTSGIPGGVTKAGNYAFDLKSLTGVGTSITSFSQPISITLTYQNSDVSGIDESSLIMYRWDGSAWTALTGCVVNTTANTITCATSNFSVFVLFGTASFVTTTSPGSLRTSGTRHYGCKDTKALNYEYFASSNPALCKYVSDITPTSTTSKYLFKRSLESGSKGDDVKALQKFLNANGYIVAKSGSGSKGSETTTFGPATKSALIKFQKAKGITPALGYFGPLTRGVVGK